MVASLFFLLFKTHGEFYNFTVNEKLLLSAKTFESFLKLYFVGQPIC